MPFTLHPVRRTASIAAAAVAVLISSTPAGGAAADGTLREVRLAQRSGAAGVSTVDAGYGYVTWVEARGEGKAQRTRIAIRRGGHVRRTAWKRGSPGLELRRRVDQVSGRAVVGLVATTCNEGGRCTDLLLSPKTLKPAKHTVWAPDLDEGGPYGGPSYAFDGTTTLRASTEPDPPRAASDADDVSRLPPSHCAFRLVGVATALPSLPDCGQPGIVVRGDIAVVAATVPSMTADDYFFATSTFDALDLKRPGAGWQHLSVGGNSKGGSSGAQQFCVLDDGVAVLSGSEDYYGDAVPTWTLSFVPIGSARVAWTAPVPQLRPGADQRGGGQIACSGTSIYANYVASAGAGKKRHAVSRLVRLKPAASRMPSAAGGRVGA